MRAKDVMSRRVVTVPSWLTLREAARIFIDEKISGAPVVDRKGAPVGVVSQTDLIRRQRERGVDTEAPAWYAEEGVRGFHVEEPDRTRVEDVMTPAVFSAGETTPVEELARLMLRRRVHRVVITRAGRLLGIVTSMDLLRALLATPRPRGPRLEP